MEETHGEMEKIFRRITDDTYAFTAGQHLLALIGLTIYSFFLYRQGLVDVFSFEQANFLRERAFFSSNWDFLRHGISYDHGKGGGIETLLFRPGVTGGLALQAIIFGAKLKLLGAFSILLHSLAAFSLYFLLMRLINPYLSLGLAAVFATQYTGIDMILWRHISLYIASVIFFIWAVYFISQLTRTDKPRLFTALSIILFIMSSLFHETIIPVLILSGLFILFVPSPSLASFAAGSRTPSGKRTLLVICFVPVLVFMCLSITDYLFIHGTSFSFIEKSGNPSAITVVQIFMSVFWYSGLLFNSFVAPYFIDISEGARFPRVELKLFSSYQEFYFIASGIVFLVLLLLLIVFAVRQIVKSSNGNNFKNLILLLFSISYIFINITGIVFGRIVPRGGVAYIYHATYYFYLSNYVIFILLTSFIVSIPSFRGNYISKKIILLFMVVIFGAQLIYNYNKIQGLLNPNSELRYAVGNLLTSIDTIVNKNKNYCFSGFNIPSSKYGLNNFDISDSLSSLAAQPCVDESNRIYGVAKSDGSLWLAKLRKPDQVIQKQVKLDLKTDNFSDAKGFPHPSKQYGAQSDFNSEAERSMDLRLFEEGRNIIMSKSEINPTEIRVTLQKPSDSGLIFAYKNPDNFVVFGINRRNMGYFKFIRNGIQASTLYLTAKFIHRETADISIRKIADAYVLFYDDYLIGELYGIKSLEGKIGLFESLSGTNGRQVFSNLTVIENNGSTSSYNIEPIFQLDVPQKSILELKTIIETAKANAHFGLGEAYFNNDRVKEGIEEFKSVISLVPDYAEAHYNLGYAYLAQGQLEEAAKEFKTAIKYNPELAEAHLNLSIIYNKQGLSGDASIELKSYEKLKANKR